MKFKLIGKYRPDDLEKVQQYQLLDFAKRFLKKFDNLLGVIKEQQPKILAEYVANLEARYQQLVKRDYLSVRKVDVSPLIAELTNLREFPQLAGIYLNYHIQFLQLPEDKEWESEKVGVTQRAYLRSALIPQYTNLQVLTETTARDEAIQLFKQHIDDYARKQIADQEDKFQTLEEFREDALQVNQEYSGPARVVGEVKDGKLIIRKDYCDWDVALEDLTDRELKYLVCCHGDFENIRSINKCFKLTMEHTIAAGDPYCDCVYYDTRITKDFTHPPKEFFDSIWLLSESE